MHGAIFLWFDPASEAAIRRGWQVFKDAGFTSEKLHSYRPHLTLSVADDINLQTLLVHLEEALKDHKSFQLDFSNIGVFCNESLVVFLAPVQHRHLGGVRSAVMNALQHADASPLPYYQHDNWTPHLSLSLDVPRLEVGRAIQLCDREEIPSQVSVVSIGIVDLEGNEIANFELQGY